LPVASDVADETGAKRNALTESAAARARFGLDYDFARGVIQQADADVVVGKSRLQLPGNFREHLVGVQRGNGVAGNSVEQGQVARFGAFFVKETRVFDGDAGLVCEGGRKVDLFIRERLDCRSLQK